MIKLSYVDLMGDQKRHEIEAEITIDHMASCYNEPVIVLGDDKPLDYMSWFLMDYRLISTDSPEEAELMEKWLGRAKFMANLE